MTQTPTLIADPQLIFTSWSKELLLLPPGVQRPQWGMDWTSCLGLAPLAPQATWKSSGVPLMMAEHASVDIKP